MSFRLGKPLYTLCLIALLVPVAGAVALSSWRGVLRDDGGKPVSAATVKLTSATGDRHYQATTTASGEFALSDIVAGDYDLSVESAGKTWRLAKPPPLRTAPRSTALCNCRPRGGSPHPARRRGVFGTVQRWRAPFQRRSFQSSPECARLQQVAAAGRRHYDRCQRRR